MASAIFGLVLGLMVAPSASAVPCKKAEITALKQVSFYALMAAASGDLTDLFAEISKAHRATKNKSLKAFYKKFESAVERDNGINRTGAAREMLNTLRTKIEYNRC
jgi:hypothetical protein